MKSRKLFLTAAICIAAWVVSMLQYHVLELAEEFEQRKHIYESITEGDAFRRLSADCDSLSKIKKYSDENTLDFIEVLTFYMFENEFDLSDKEIKLYKKEAYCTKRTDYIKRYGDEWEKVLRAYKAIFYDVEFFPVPESSTDYPINVCFKDGWGSNRAYKDVIHLHEGTDIMAIAHERGYVPVVSMTDGVVENIGWLELGGYRIGIRSKNDGYFYYAHLFRYARDFNTGDEVKAGEIIGFMGDSGYGTAEGTVGNFDVHLHVGIYIRTEHYGELAVNPYGVLDYIKDKRAKCILQRG